MSFIKERFTSAHGIALLALFVAMGGTGYAAITLPKNSVKAKQIAKNAVRSGEVKNGSLKSIDFAAGQLPAGPAGPQGAPGPPGPQGTQGDPGPNGTFGSVTTQTETAVTALADNSKASYDVHCPEGQTALGGGARGDATDSEFTNVTSSRPIISTTNGGAPGDGGTFTGWRVTVFNPSGGVPPDGDILPQVWVVCATPLG